MSERAPLIDHSEENSSTIACDEDVKTTFLSVDDALRAAGGVGHYQKLLFVLIGIANAGYAIGQ